MGNHPSNHQPLDRGNVGKFGDVATVGHLTTIVYKKIIYLTCIYFKTLYSRYHAASAIWYLSINYVKVKSKLH